MDERPGKAESAWPLQDGRGDVHVPAAKFHAGIHRGHAGCLAADRFRYIAVLAPLIRAVLEEFVPSAADAIKMVKGQVCLVDGTIHIDVATTWQRISAGDWMAYAA